MVFEALLKISYQPPSYYLDGEIIQNGASMHERAEVQWKLRFVLFPRPNNKTEVDMKYLLGLRKPYKPGKGFFRHV